MFVHFLLFLPFFLFECISTIFFILFSLPTSTKRTIVVSFLSWKNFFCSEVLLWTHSRVQLEAPSGAKARRRSCPGRFFTGQDVEVILAIFASRPLVDPQFLWFEICVLQWLLVYREDMSGKTCVMLFRFVSLTCYELLGQFFDPQSNIIGKKCVPGYLVVLAAQWCRGSMGAGTRLPLATRVLLLMSWCSVNVWCHAFLRKLRGSLVALWCIGVLAVRDNSSVKMLNLYFPDYLIF